jgi:carbamoyl-phosphate synthase large subunit
MKKTILLSPIGAKSSLLKVFDASTDDDFEVVAADANPSAPAQIGRALSIKVPLWTSSAWPDVFLSICEAKRVSLLVSLADGELAALATIADELKAMRVQTLLPVLSNSLVICKDKRLTAGWFEERGLPFPKTIPPVSGLSQLMLPATCSFPLFARPEVGQGSFGGITISSQAMLSALDGQARGLIIQEMVTDPEYSIDVLSSFDGQALQAVVRRRLVVRGGESTTTQVVQCPELEALALKVCDGLGLVGHSVVQAFWSEQHGPRLIEVNPRFGGASTLSIRAGLDSPRRIVGMLRGDPDAYRNRPIQIGLVMHRVAEDFFVEPATR